VEVTGAERDLLNQAIETVRRLTGDDVHKEILKADAGKDFRKLDSFKREWAGLPASIRNDITFVIRSRALALLSPRKDETEMEFVERLETGFDLANILDEVRSYAQSIRPLRPDPFAEAVALAAIEIWEGRGQTFLVGNREAPSEFSRFLASTLIEFLPTKYQLGDRLRTEEFRQSQAVRDAIAVLDRLAEEGRIKKKPRTKDGG
jgi:hypothetical protein